MDVVRIGISANFFHADPERAVFRHKTLQYLEERMALAIFRAGAVPVMLPDLKDPGALASVMGLVDGLVLAGGADVSPTSYGQTPLRDTWRGDAVRDAYECQLVRLATERGLPILGICRGIQLLNVALGGTLWQDINTQVEGTLVHRDWHRYDENGHGIRVDADSWVGQVYGGRTELQVNSIHHQAIAELAPGLRATAWAPDGIVEAAESIEPARFIAAVQWHPEWLEAERVADGAPDAGRAAGAAIFDAFVRRCAQPPTAGAGNA
jgi:putative glutamine amidotransferase